MSILEWQVNSISNFASFFIVLTHNSPQIFKLIHFLLCIKGSNESPNFENFLALVKICQIPHVVSQTTSQLSFKFLHQTLLSWNKAPLYPFRSNIIYFGQKQPIKCKFLRLSSSRVKIHQILYVNFETTSKFLFRFYNSSSVSLLITPL